MSEQIRSLDLDSLIYPLFIKEGSGVWETVDSMPGVRRFSPDTVVEEVAFLREIGIRRLLLFGVQADKDAPATGAYRQDNVVSRAVLEIKRAFPDVAVTTDVCLCAYTDHGHCGILGEGGSAVLRDKGRTLEALAQMALSHAAAGADCVAPSAMMDGQVGVLRGALDSVGFSDTRILAYSAKFASHFYGPFREAADSAPRRGEGRTYQLSVDASAPALQKIADDIAQGADMVMVKPALGYQDIIRQAKDRFRFPLACYNVSGEYAMVKTGAQMGWWDERKMVMEVMAGLRRSGADVIISYHARDIAVWRNEGEKSHEQ